MYEGKFVGTFKRHHTETSEEGVEHWVALNEKGKDYYKLRNRRTQKYVLLTLPDSNIVSGIDEEGMFSFPYPYNVYFLDEIPDDLAVGEYIYDGKTFKPYIDVGAWKHNMNLKIKDEMLESLMKGEVRTDLQEMKSIVDAYEGDGYTPPLPF